MQKANAAVLCRSETGCKEDLTHNEQVLSFYAKEKGYAVTRVYREYGDGEMSGRTSLRDFRRMAKYGEIQAIFLPELNTFGDNPECVTEEIRYLTEYGVKVISLKDGELTTDRLPALFRSQFRVI